MKKTCSFNERCFQRALGCICTVFRSRDCSTSRSHLNPARSGKKSHRSLSELTLPSLMEEMNKYVPRFLPDVSHGTGCLCAALARVSAELTYPAGMFGTQLSKTGWFNEFSHYWIGLPLTQIIFFLSQNMWLHRQRMVVGTGVLLTITEDQSLLWMWIGRNSTKRDTQEKPLENWHWAQCLFPDICEESKEVDRPRLYLP